MTVVYDILGRRVNSGSHGYALIVGDEPDCDREELLAFLRGRHPAHPGMRLVFSAGDAETGESFRFAYPPLAEAYARTAYPGQQYVIVALPKTYASMQHRWTRNLVYVVPEPRETEKG